jgi:subtilisin family serine protease
MPHNMIIIFLQDNYSSPINKFKRSIMKHHYKTSSLLTLLFVALLFTTSNINAQVSQNIVEYKGSKVVANSVIVKVDETKFKLNGLQVSNQARLESIKSGYGVEDTKKILFDGAEEWKVKVKDYENVLGQLNSVPGISAFPNYYFSRGEYEITKAKQFSSNMDGSEVSSNRFFKGNFNGATLSLHSPERNDHTNGKLPTVYNQDFSNGIDGYAQAAIIYRDGENIVLNGGFDQLFESDDYRLWEENLSENNGQFGSVSIDDTLKFTISQAGNPWDVQVWQELAPIQIDGLTMGGTWELSFKAMSPDGDKTFHVFLGENGGGWDRYWAADGDGLVTVDGDWKTYTLTTEVDRSWENMKLGFEVGADANDLQIDDVVLKHIPKNIVFNGDFSHGDSLWATEGNRGTISFDDSLKFVVESSGNPWELQAYQPLSAEQIAALAQGGDWELTFDAMSPDGAKSFHVFLGEVGGGWARYWDGNVDVDGEMKTYTLNTNITQTWDNMKLGFEVSGDTADLIIDNISLNKVSPSGLKIETNEGIANDAFGWASNNSDLSYTFLEGYLDGKLPTEFYGGYRSPLLDLSGLDSTKIYRMKFDFDNAALGYKELYIQSSNNGEVAFDMSGYDEYIWYILPASFIGDTIFYEFVVDGLAISDETVVAFDNIVIEEYPVNDPLITNQYAFYNDGTWEGGGTPGADMSVFDAWELATGSDSAIVVVFDDGVDFSHPDLAHNAWVNSGEDLNGDGVISADEVNGVDDDQNGFVDDFHGWAPVYQDNRYINAGSFHGTHVAGTVGAVGNNGIGVSGVAQKVKIINVMMFDEFGGSSSAAILEGFQYISTLLDQGVEIIAINHSWGGGSAIVDEASNAFVMEMTAYAKDHGSHGAVWSVSAGNSSLNRDDQMYYSYPNNINSANIITVASSTAFETPSSFTDFGNYTVDIFAPGSDIMSTYPDNQYVYMSGTSMASPHVTGAIALAKAYFPDESGVELMTRILANGDAFNQYMMVGEGERLNAHANLNPEKDGNIIPSHDLFSGYHRLFFEDSADQQVGFVNNSSESVTISGSSFNDAPGFKITADPTSSVVAPGGVFSTTLSYFDPDSSNSTGQLVFNLSSGVDVSIPLYGRTLEFPSIRLSEENTFAGEVELGDVVSGSFDIINESEIPLYFNVMQSLQLLDPEMNESMNELITFEPIISIVKDKKLKRDKVIDRLKGIDLGDYDNSESIKLEIDPDLFDHDEGGGTGGTPIMGEPITLWMDDLNDPDYTLTNWIVRDLTAVGESWELFNLSEPENAENLVFLAGDFATGYLDDAFTDAITPSFDFSNLVDAEGNEYMPAYLEFDYAALLEDGYDQFLIAAFINGGFAGMIDETYYGTLIADGSYQKAIIDISMYAGETDVRFAFILSSDMDFVEGWGALFDNVGIAVAQSPYFMSETDGMVEPGNAETVTVGVETAKMGVGTGTFSLISMIDNNSLDGFYYGPAVHSLDFMIKNNPPVANDDTMMVVSGDVINTLDIAAFAASNDYDDSGQAYVTDITDPVYGSFKYLEIDGPPYYVAPLNFDGMDMITYQISDGMDYAEAVIYIMVMAEPGFKTGSNQQFVLLEDNELTLSTMTMAAGVGGMDKNMMVWGKSMHDAVQVTHTPGEHVIMITAAEDYYGQSEAMLYAGHEDHVMDSMMVSVVITPVNDAPVASFNIEQNQAGGSEFNFANTSNDARDPEGAIVQYEWNFGDGTISNEKDPYHNYSIVGDYSVTLKVTDNSGSEAEYSENVSVTVLTSSEDLSNPNVYSLAQNYPNPFNPSTLIQYSIAEPGNVTLEVYNMLGQKVAQLVNGTQNAGAHTVQFDASALSSGVYIYQLKAGNYLETRKMMLIK